MHSLRHLGVGPRHEPAVRCGRGHPNPGGRCRHAQPVRSTNTTVASTTRVSTLEQTLALQQDALTKAACERLFTDTASGSLTQRTGLTEALGFARPGDTLVVWRLDRLGRSLRHLIDTVALLQGRGIGFRSLQEQIDTTTSGKLVFHVFGALAEFERDLIKERTQAGLLAARARGRLGGRPKALDPRKAQIAQALYHDKTNTIADICRTLRISRATLYRYLETGTGKST